MTERTKSILKSGIFAIAVGAPRAVGICSGGFAMPFLRPAPCCWVLRG